MNKNDLNEKPVSADLYNSEYYEKYNHGYDDFLKNKGLMKELEEKVKHIDYEDKKVLDAACGRGEFVRYAAERGAHATGYDYSQSAVDICNEMIQDLHNDIKSRISFDVMDAKKLNYADNTFDMAVMFDIIEHLHDWELKQAISEIYRVLKPGGELFVHTSPNKHMMDLVRLVVTPFGISLKSSEFHVNEITYHSMKNYMQHFDGEVILEKDVDYWSKQMVFRGSKIKTLAKVLDSVVDFGPVHFLMDSKPINILTATDIWFIGQKPVLES